MRQSDYNTYSEVKVRNNWGRLSYHVNDEKLEAGKPYRIMWPDGMTQTMTFEAEKIPFKVYDHGHMDTGYTHQLVFHIPYHGSLIKLILGQVNIKVSTGE